MPEIPAAVRTLDGDLREVFGARVRSVVVYGIHAREAEHRHAGNGHGHGEHASLVHTLAVVDSLAADDLRACAVRLTKWHDLGLATPLLLASDEFARSLDVFPFELNAILADHAVVSGASPFDGLRVEAADLRRACEVQARGHLLHLRQAFVETRGRADALAVLIVRSAPAWASLLQNVARLDGHSSHDRAAAARHVERLLTVTNGVEEVVRLAGVQEIPSADALRIFPGYLDAVERLTKYVDRWRQGDSEACPAPGRARLLCPLPSALCSSRRSDALEPPPALIAPVNDFAHVIDARSAAQIDRLSRALKAASGDVVVVATIPTIEGYGDIREYAVKMFENHGQGIGDKGKDNGLLILLAIKERKVWVEVGYGLEPWITDRFSGETSRQYMVPQFRNGSYGLGLVAGTSRIVNRIADGRQVRLEGIARERDAQPGGGSIWPLLPDSHLHRHPHHQPHRPGRRRARRRPPVLGPGPVERMVERRGSVWRRAPRRIRRRGLRRRVRRVRRRGRRVRRLRRRRQRRRRRRCKLVREAVN